MKGVVGKGGLSWAALDPPTPLSQIRTDPVRPFISGHVANSMAAEVIALLHSLLMAPESNAAQIWTTTAEKVSRRRTHHLASLFHPVLLSLLWSGLTILGCLETSEGLCLSGIQARFPPRLVWAERSRERLLGTGSSS